MQCFNEQCKKVLVPVIEDDPSVETSLQYDNALEIQFDGGYGMFIDPMGDEAHGFHAVICHDCAITMCTKVPWVAKLLQPIDSHSHKEGEECVSSAVSLALLKIFSGDGNDHVEIGV